MPGPIEFIRRLNRRISDRIYGAHAEYNYESIAPHVPEGATVLDVGAWNCRVGALLAERKRCDVLNVDVVDKNVTPLPLVLFDGKTLPVPDGSRDIVSFLYVLHHAPDDSSLLAEARRVVRRGGRVLIGEDMVDSLWQRIVTVGFHIWLLLFTGMGWKGKFRTLAAWRERFAAAGLRLVETRPLGPHMGKRLWPHNVVFVLEPGPGAGAPGAERAS
jgi:SAM-dependent methyltransferase